MSSFAAPCPEATPRVVHVTVTEKDGTPTVDVQPSCKLRVHKGQKITWTFTNLTTRDMDLGVANFRWNGQFGTKDQEMDHPDPFRPGDPRHVKVGRSEKKEFAAEAQPRVNDIRSYKYDIVDGTTVLVDPEIEVWPK